MHLRSDQRRDGGPVAESAPRSGHVEERLVERDRLDELGHRSEDGVHLLADLRVQRVVAAEEERVGAQTLRAE